MKLFILSKSLADKTKSNAPMLSKRCSFERVPGMGSMEGELILFSKALLENILKRRLNSAQMLAYRA